MLRKICYIAWILVVIGLLGSILGTAAILAQQLLTLGVAILLGAALHAVFRQDG